MRTVHLVFGLLVAAALPSAFVFAGQTPNLSGTWIADANGSLKLVFEQKGGNLHVQEMEGEKVKADFTCTLNGQECSVKQDGHSEKVMLYFNGAKLVEIRERGADTIKERFTVSDDGKTLTEETVPLSATQKAETLSFRRQAA
jgi:hypothetical protein